MTLLTIVQDAAVDLGLAEPSVVIASTDLATKKLLKYANRGGKHLAGYHDWQTLIVEQAYTSIATEEQTNALPSNDYDRMVYNPEIWDRTSNLRLTGPTPQRYWALLKSGVSVGGVTGYWRILGKQLRILPVMSAGHTLGFEYISKRWVQSSGGVRQETFLNDADTSLVPEELITLEIIWRFRHSRGFAQYAEDLSTAEREKEKMAAADRGTGRIRPESSNDGQSPQQPGWTGTVAA